MSEEELKRELRAQIESAPEGPEKEGLQRRLERLEKEWLEDTYEARLQHARQQPQRSFNREAGGTSEYNPHSAADREHNAQCYAQAEAERSQQEFNQWQMSQCQ